MVDRVVATAPHAKPLAVALALASLCVFIAVLLATDAGLDRLGMSRPYPLPIRLAVLALAGAAAAGCAAGALLGRRFGWRWAYHLPDPYVALSDEELELNAGGGQPSRHFATAEIGGVRKTRWKRSLVIIDPSGRPLMRLPTRFSTGLTVDGFRNSVTLAQLLVARWPERFVIADRLPVVPTEARLRAPGEPPGMPRRGRAAELLVDCLLVAMVLLVFAVPVLLYLIARS